LKRAATILIALTAACGSPPSEQSPDAGALDAAAGADSGAHVDAGERPPPPHDAGSSGRSYRIVAAERGPLQAAPGDAIALRVVGIAADGTTMPLSATSSVTWLDPPTVVALSPYSTQNIPLWTFGTDPSAYFLANPFRPDRPPDLSGVLFVLDPGPSGAGYVGVRVSVIEGGSTFIATASISVSASATASASIDRGRTVYGRYCGRCHGATGGGSPPASSGGFLVGGVVYPYPAPPINASRGRVGSDRSWNAALFAMAARSDVDNQGHALRAPMPDWLSTSTAASALSTADFGDIYTFLASER
jgi:mono/diheme cytochrome c family protein